MQEKSRFETQHENGQNTIVDNLLPRLRAYLTMMPDVKLAYFQPGPSGDEITVSGADHPRVIVAFTRNISSAQVAKRLVKIRRHFAPMLPDEVEFLDIERLDYREACEIAFNERMVYGSQEAVERDLAERFPDVRFIAIGATLEQITAALGQLSLAASLVGGLAVGNGLLVLLGSLAAGRKQRQADAVITKVLGSTRYRILLVAMIQYGLLALFAAVLATPVGLVLAFMLNEVLLDVQFSFATTTLAIVIGGAIVFTAILGATTILSALRPRPALRLREMGAD